MSTQPDFMPSRRHTGAAQKNLTDREDHPPIALLLVDVLNSLDFAGNEYIRSKALHVGQQLKALKAKCRTQNIPVPFVFSLSALPSRKAGCRRLAEAFIDGMGVVYLRQ
jgi:hypothetical protein